MVKNYPTLKNLAPLFFLLFGFAAFSQTTGDFRSIASGNWTSLTSWQYFNGTDWVTPSGTNPQGYPGQFAGTGTVTIQNTNNITINTNITNSFTALVIGGGVSGILTVAENINVSTLSITINAGGIMTFDKNKGITFPANAYLFINSPGKIDTTINCTNNNEINIGDVKYATCTGSGNADFTFEQLNSEGGSLKSNPSYNSPVCGNTISLIGAYTGVINNTKPVTYSWTATGPSSVTFNPNTNTNASPIVTINPSTYPSVYSFTLIVSNDGNSNSKTISVTVNAPPEAPTVGTITQPTCSLATGSVVLNGLPAAGTWTLTRTPGAITSTGTGTNTTINSLTAGTYTYTVTNAAGCASTASANVVIGAQPVINTWNGSVSTDWNTASNWCVGVPTIGFPNTLDVVIPDGLTNYPIIAFDGLRGVVNNIEIQPDASITIAGVIDILTGTGTGNVLTIIGDLILNGIIDLNGESQLIQVKDNGLSGTGTIEIDQQGTGNSFWYNYWSSPVTPVNSTASYTIKEVLRDGDGTGTIDIENITFGAPYAFADVARAVTDDINLSTYWMNVLRNNKGYSSWVQVRHTGNIAIGVGFSMKGSNTADYLQNYTFVGKPNNGEIKVPITGNNQYLIGNPYPSAIDAKEFIKNNAPPLGSPIGTPGTTTGTLYFWEHYGGTTHYLSDYIGGYATYSYAGGVAATSAITGSGGPVSSIKKEPGQFIPVGQGFFVVGGDVDGDIIFQNSQRIFKKESESQPLNPISVFMKNSNTKAKTENAPDADLRPKFRIGFDAPKINHRQLLFTIDERATPAVDWGFDAKIYQVFADDMYWMLDGKKYVIQAMNSVGLNSEVPIGIQLSKTGMVTVKIDALENVDDDTTIYLKDKLTGETFNMREKPVQLNLTAGKYADRFVLVLKTQKLVAEDVKAEILIPAAAQPVIEGIHVFMSNAIGELQIKNNSTEEIVSVALLNSLGQTVKTWNSNFNIRTISLPISTATGVYLVQITTKTGKTVKKISVE